MGSARSNQPSSATSSERSLLSRVMYVTVGFLFLIIGIAGYIVPGLPGTPLLLVAAWLFSMSNDRLHTWMTTNRWFGQTIADYQAGLGISRRVKTYAIASMAVVVPLSIAFGTSDWVVRIVIVALAVIGVIFVLTRPTRELAAERS